MSKANRVSMPATAALVDEMRAALGADLVNAALRRAAQGRGVFYATETLADGTVLSYGRPPMPARAEWVIPEVFPWRLTQ